MWSTWRLISLTTILAICCLCAAALPTVSGAWPESVSTDMLEEGTIDAGAVDYYMTFDGRQLNLYQLTLDAGLSNNLSLGGKYCVGSGHGHSKSNTYSDHGKEFSTKYRLVKECGAIPSLALYGEYTSDKAELHTTEATVNATTTSTGAQLLAGGGTPFGGWRWHARVGGYQTKVVGDTLATTYLAGGDVVVPMSKRMNLRVAATAFDDNYSGGTMTEELLAALSLYPGCSRITLAGSLYPKGVPLAATPLSPAAAVGTFVGGSATENLRTKAMGYISLGLNTIF